MTVSEAVSLAIGNFETDAWPIIINILITLSPIFLVAILFAIMWDLWIQYVQAKFLLSLDRTVLELKLPKDTYKSPAAMEIFLNSIHNTSDGSKYAQLWKGEGRPYYSLEIVSIEGNVKFFIWTEDRRKNGVISGLYAQFPEIEIREVEDYAKSVHFDPKVTRIWASEFKFAKEDPYPIKTYVDYGLDRDPKEELKTDPMTPMIEFLGSVPANQQVWIQIMVVAHRKKKKPGHWFKQTDAWEDEARELVNKLMIRDEKTKVTGKNVKEGQFPITPTLSEGEKKVVEALDRSITKHPFDVGIRALYIAPKDKFDTPFGIGGVISSFKQFSSTQLNGFKPTNWHSNLQGQPWEDYKNFRRNKYARLALTAYKMRSYFYQPFKAKPMVLNSEELATIYHFPGSVAATPGLERVPSKKAQAPTNLPI